MGKQGKRKLQGIGAPGATHSRTLHSSPSQFLPQLNERAAAVLNGPGMNYDNEEARNASVAVKLSLTLGQDPSAGAWTSFSWTRQKF